MTTTTTTTHLLLCWWWWIITTACCFFIFTTTTTTIVVAAEEEAPPFFLQATTDGKCLSSTGFFVTCSIETLFFVQGSPGTYKIHVRPIHHDKDDKDEDDGFCLVLTTPNHHAAVRTAPCQGIQGQWNILGDADTGYVLTATTTATTTTTDTTTDNDNVCIGRNKNDNSIEVAPCMDNTYVTLSLRFASAADVHALSSMGARCTAAAASGQLGTVQKLLHTTTTTTEDTLTDWEGRHVLQAAASTGQMEICEYVLVQAKHHQDVDATDQHGRTALHEAAEQGHLNVVELLLNHGALLDRTANDGTTAAWMAAANGQAAVVEWLVSQEQQQQQQASVWSVKRSTDDATALHMAAAGGHAQTVRILLSAAAAAENHAAVHEWITATDRDGLTALHHAVENGSVQVVQALLESIKDDDDEKKEFVNVISTTGFTPLIIAAAHGHAETVTVLVQNGAILDSTAGDNQVTALMYAAAANHVNVLTSLLMAGATVNVQHSNGGTALLEAATGAAPEALAYLLEKGGADPVAADNDGVTALMAIASQGSLEGQEAVLTKLQEKLSLPETVTEHINLFSYSGGSAVMFAAAGGHVDCAKRLRELGADVHAIARATPEYLVKLAEMIEAGTVSPEEEEHVDGVTALHVAAQGGHVDTVRWLLVDEKVAVTVLDDEKRTALTMAVKGNHAETAQLLVEHGADPNTLYVDDDDQAHNLLFDAIMVENQVFAQLLIAKGADIYYTDEQKVTTLLQASHRGFDDVVDALLARHKEGGGGGGGGGDFLNSASNDGVTPLLAASTEGHEKIVRSLVQAGAKVDLPDGDGTTALMAASARGHVESLRELLAGGAVEVVNTQNKDGHTALMFAYNGKNQVETLWERYQEFASGGVDQQKEAEASGTGPILREALDNHLALLDLLFKAGADVNIKDKEGNKAKDFDYHPEADASVSEKINKGRDESKNEL